MHTNHHVFMDVTDVACLGEKATVAVTVQLPLPDALPANPVICFAKPGAGYSRRYFTEDLPGPAKGAQAAWHVAQGWIFVSVDSLGVGEGSQHAPDRLDYPTVTAANHAAETEIVRRLAEGTLVPGLPKVLDPVRIGIGQSMGGSLTIAQQGQYHSYDGIAVLGYSAVWTNPSAPSGRTTPAMPWRARDRNGPPLNAALLGSASQPDMDAMLVMMGWNFHHDNVDPTIVAADIAPLKRHFSREAEYAALPWHSLTTPGAVVSQCTTPGVVASEAAAVRVPVLCAMGDRDSVPDPRGEVRAYLSAPSVDLFICPDTAHMHNFGGKRVLFWERIALFADWVRAWKEAGR